MYFQSAGFLFIFLPLLLLLTRFFPTGATWRIALVLLSYLFYSGGEPFFCILLLSSSIADYFIALRIGGEQAQFKKRAWLSLSILINLGLLCFFKYSPLFIETFGSYAELGGLASNQPDFLYTLALPAGISFYTFQTLAYSIDVYRGQIRPTADFWGFLLFVSYLPQLIAGPIERFANLYPQLGSNIRKHPNELFLPGLNRLATGIAQKLILADSCGRIVDTLISQPGSYTFVTSWGVAIGFGMQIYFDFAAYTSMAIGISMMLGIRLSENFNSPYQANSIREFWRRWHMTLSGWFRDYLYIPLGGSRKGGARTAINVVLTFALCGLWHGAGWNFVVWGLGHGLALSGYILWSRSGITLPRTMAILTTFIVVHFLWVVFRIDDSFQAISIWTGMLGQNGWNDGYLSLWDVVFLGLMMVIVWAVPNCSQRWPGKSGPWESLFIMSLAIFAVFNSPQVNQFIYFRF